MTRPCFALALLCLTGLAAVGSCARVSLEPGSAAARPVTFQISMVLPEAASDGTASSGGNLTGITSFTDDYQTTTNPSYNATISHALTGTASYRWYLNGATLTDASPDGTITVGGAASDTGVLAIGTYRLSGVVTDADADAIATVDWVFEVTD
ncbi:MAG: hypothetical protein JXA15_00885 [Spirochaetales bacterium]|nr:hypothetical protein [Spirochaetales bacterium]